MGLSLAALVIDNDMLGSILRASSTVTVSPETIALESIDRVACGVGHFLASQKPMRGCIQIFYIQKLLIVWA